MSHQNINKYTEGWNNLNFFLCLFACNLVKAYIAYIVQYSEQYKLSTVFIIKQSISAGARRIFAIHYKNGAL